MITMIISPSILSTDLSRIKETMELINDSNAMWIHLDVMDGVFVPNTTFDHNLVKEVSTMTSKTLDVHLMVVNPEEKVLPYLELNAEYITYHFEATTKHLYLIDLIHKHNKKVGISIKPNTNVEELIPYLPLIDLVLVMSVEPGFGGQSFMPSATSKIDTLVDLRTKNNYHYLIEVDGGINNQTITHVLKADVVVSGSYLFKQSSFSEAVDGLLAKA